MYESQKMSNKKAAWRGRLDTITSDTYYTMDSYREGRQWGMGDLMQIAYKLEKLGHRGEVIHEEFIRSGRRTRGSHSIRTMLVQLQATGDDYESFLRWNVGIKHKIIPRYTPKVMIDLAVLPTEQIQIDTQREFTR